MSHFSRGSSQDTLSSLDKTDDRDSPATPRQTYNNRDSFTTMTSSNSGSTASSGSSMTGSYTDSTMSGDSMSKRLSVRSSSTHSSVVQAEILDLENMIYKFKEQLDFQRRRADTEERRAIDAEKRLHEYAEHLAKVNKARLVAQQEANRASEELRLYKMQLEYAQREINRAQSVLDLVDKQRCQAEKEASEAKAKARKLSEELIVENARREGRRQGLQEGLDRGRDLILQETQGVISHRRTSTTPSNRLSLGASSFMSESDDTRTISTESHVTLLADGRPRNRDRRDSDAPIALASPPPLPVPAPKPPSRASSIGNGYSSSKAPSVVHEPPPKVPFVIFDPQPPSVAFEHSASRATSVAHDHPQRVTSPSAGYPEFRPASAQGYSPMARFNTFVPPDNLIPNLELDGVIRIPPPHGFSKPPLTPERPPSPSLPQQQSDPHHLIHRHSSPDSASTTLSHLDLLNDPHHGYVAVTPALSAIEEVSTQASPYPEDGYDLRQQSVAGSSVGRGSGSVINSPYTGSDRGSYVNIHQRDRSTSSFVPSIHERAPSVISRTTSKKGSSMRGTPIAINVQPPSLPVSEGTRSISRSEQLSPLPHETVPFPSSFSPYSAISPTGSSTNGIPIVPDNKYDGTIHSPALTEKDDDAVSSRISGDEDFFTTPPPSGAPRSLSKPPESVVSVASAKTSKTSKTSKTKSSRNR